MSFQTSNSGAFRSLHCLIYKVLAAASVAERFLSYHTFLSLSSTFFNFFRSFFSAWLTLLSASESFVILSHQLSFVKCFFQLFQSFSALDSLPASSFRKLDYLTTSASVCQVLFSDSLEAFLTSPSNPAPLSDSSLTIPNLPPLVNTFLEKNLCFFRTLTKTFSLHRDIVYLAYSSTRCSAGSFIIYSI